MEWINIKNQLPEKNIYVLTYTPNLAPWARIGIKFVFSNIVKEMMSSKSRFYHVTHWMPLPSPPKE